MMIIDNDQLMSPYASELQSRTQICDDKDAQKRCRSVNQCILHHSILVFLTVKAEMNGYRNVNRAITMWKRLVLNLVRDNNQFRTKLSNEEKIFQNTRKTMFDMNFTLTSKPIKITLNQQHEEHTIHNFQIRRRCLLLSSYGKTLTLDLFPSRVHVVYRQKYTCRILWRLSPPVGCLGW